MGLKETGQKVFLIMGDGECNEGQVWEMALSAAHHKVNNLFAFVDYNHKQLDGVTDDILNTGNIAGKFESFGWYSREVDGHDAAEIYDTLKEAEVKAGEISVMIVLNTAKGKGVKFIEEIEFNHHFMISREDADRALEEIRSEMVQ